MPDNLLDHRSAVTPLLTVPKTPEALEFYAEAFGAEELFRLTMPDGAVVHAQMLVHGALVMLADEDADHGHLSSASLGGSPVKLHLTVPDVDDVVARAKAAGAEELIPVGDQFYGERSGRVRDPFGHVWIVSTITEAVAPEEMQRRMDAMMGGSAA